MVDVVSAMSKAKARMLMRHVFFASMLLNTKLVERNDIPTAATDMRKIYYNAEFMAGLDSDVCLFVLAHEVMHIVLKHGVRRGSRNPELSNIAQDFAINIMLKKSGFKLWDKCYHDKWNNKPVNFDGMSFEQIYDELKKDIEENGGKVGELGDQGGLGGDVMPCGDLTPEEVAQVERQIMQKVAQAATQARMCGSMPGELEHLVNGILNPPLTWQELLREFANVVSHDDESWNHRNRRHQGVYLPTRHNQKMGELVWIGDTSGSLIGSDIFGQVGVELTMIAETLRPERVRVIWADDAECSSEQVFEAGEEIILVPMGGGGTDMREPLKYVEQFDPLVVIMSTDCYTPWPESVPFPLIVLSNTSSECPEELGRTIHI